MPPDLETAGTSGRPATRGLPGPEAREALHRERHLAWDQEEDGFSTLKFTVLDPIHVRPSSEEGWIEVYVPSKDRWKTVRERWRPILEGFATGLDLLATVDHAAERLPDRNHANLRFLTRAAANKLVSWGMAEVELPPVPDVFVDRYERVEELGRGGMGIVWRCTDLETGRDVAVKHAWNWSGSFEKRERYLREEAEVMAACDHPTITRFHASFQHEDRFHLVREFVQGRPLNQAASRGLDRAERGAVLADVIEALEHLMDRGWMCLDIKTSNFLLTEQGRVKLADLGLTRQHEDRAVELKGHIGTRSYADPTLRETKRADERALVFSVGRLYSCLVTGSSPRARVSLDGWRDSYGDLVERVRAAGALEDEVELVRRACDIDREARPGSLRELLEITA